MNNQPFLRDTLPSIKKTGLAIAVLLMIALTAHAGDIVIESGKIDVDGYVTSTVPAFSATLSAHHTAQSVIKFDVVTVNNGGHYDTATGRFTAPVDGSYQICFGGIEYPQNGRSYADIHVNGALPAGGRVYSYAAGSYDGVFKCIIVNLNAGDYVDVMNMDSGQGWYQNPYASFSGHLLTAQ